MVVGVSATGRRSFRLDAVDCCGTDTMVAVLKHVQTTAWASDRLKIRIRAGTIPVSQYIFNGKSLNKKQISLLKVL